MLHPLPKNVFSSRLEKISAPRLASWGKWTGGLLRRTAVCLNTMKCRGKRSRRSQAILNSRLKLIEHFIRCLVRLSISSAASRTSHLARHRRFEHRSCPPDAVLPLLPGLSHLGREICPGPLSPGPHFCLLAWQTLSCGQLDQVTGVAKPLHVLRLKITQNSQDHTRAPHKS